jgi:hypothetical protein
MLKRKECSEAQVELGKKVRKLILYSIFNDIFPEHVKNNLEELIETFQLLQPKEK